MVRLYRGHKWAYDCKATLCLKAHDFRKGLIMSANIRLSLTQDDPSPNLFAQEVRNCAGGTVTLGLWSAKVHTSLPFQTHAHNRV